jgi:transcriptional regulator, MarR family
MHGGEGRHGERAGRTLPFDIDAEGTKGLYARLRECGHYLFHRQGAYVGQERVLKELSENGGTMSQRELTERLQLQRASVSEILGKLELRALIEREQSMRDRRSQDISLTAEGKRAAEGIAGRQEAEYNGLFDEITEEEQKTLYELLGKLLEKWRGRQK